ncbi:unnamed protein product [Owenia fusiformis]|uniref:Uncharacterized protein n=1 Tax=Owenia fusiformis TaxID=6347 RepID=A0A8J1TPT0_OWEFU|nr:unnamed protein product [Owenia fusiformis]
MANMPELVQIIEHDIPDCRNNLLQSRDNLRNVAGYCESNYIQSADKRHALEETKNFTTQSLASVAYQINTLATNFLQLLDLQTNQLAEMESSVNHLSQTVMIHKEKVARREIGVITTNKSATRPQGVKNPGIIFPEQSERPIKYTRPQIDYSTLDDIGHGVKVQTSNPRVQRADSSASSMSHMSERSSSISGAPQTKPPTPPMQKSAGDTLTRRGSHISNSPYRVPAPVVPSDYAANYPRSGSISSQQSNSAISRNSTRSSTSHYDRFPGGRPTDAPPAPPTGMVLPMSHGPGVAPPPPQVMQHQQSVDEPLPPMPHNMDRPGNLSPPLPPPPDMTPEPSSPLPPPMSFDQHPMGYMGEEIGRGSMMPSGEQTPEWVPENYLEKVVAIYDYEQDKDDELSFSENTVIYVIKKNDDGWWEGVIDGQTGLFPGNYVEGCI